MITVQQAMSQRDKKREHTEQSHKQWAKRWDKKCKAEFTDYVPPTHARLS